MTQGRVKGLVGKGGVVLSWLDRIREVQLRDQFSDATRVVRRNALIASSVAILLGLPDIKLGNFLGIDLSGPKAGVLAIGSVALVAAYESVSFIIYASIDHARWRIDPGAILINASAEELQRIQSSTADIRSLCGEIRDRSQQPLSGDAARLHAASG